jgi:TolB-like protein/predicted Zn-dependent protease
MTETGAAPADAEASTDQERSADPPAPRKESVAVLPFLNLSDDPQNEYFSDGLTETLLHMLAQLPELQVAARTSSFAFKGQNRDVSEIAATLGVAHVLEGSVQKAGGQVRVTAQLVRADDGFHVWSQNYTRPLEDIFAIQDEIAGDVADALGASLLGTDGRRLEGVHTANLGAYESWLKGLEEQAKFAYASLALAESHFKQALAQDPDFYEARVSLIRNHLLAYQTGMTDEAATEAAIRPLLAQVRENDPDNPHARAYELMFVLSAPRVDLSGEDVRAVIDELRGLLAELPTETLVRLLVAGTLEGWFDDDTAAVEVLSAGLLIDPLEDKLHSMLGDIYAEAGRLAQAEASYRRALELEPGNPNTYWDLRGLDKRRGDMTAALEWGLRATEVDPQDHEYAVQMAWDFYDLGLAEEAGRWKARADALAPGSVFARNLAWHAAVARGDDAEARAIAEALIAELPTDRRDNFLVVLFGYADRSLKLGRAREAYEFIVQAHPGTDDYTVLAPRFEGVMLKVASIFLMTGFAPEDRCREAWINLTQQFDAMGFPWRNGANAVIDPLFRGDIEGAVEQYLAFTEGPVTNQLGEVRRPLETFFAPIYADPRVAARLAELDEEYRQVRADVQEMLQGPEWTR